MFNYIVVIGYTVRVFQYWFLWTGQFHLCTTFHASPIYGISLLLVIWSVLNWREKAGNFMVTPKYGGCVILPKHAICSVIQNFLLLLVISQNSLFSIF